jgi:WD40 repeat protein
LEKFALKMIPRLRLGHILINLFAGFRFSGSGKRLVSASRSGIIKIWDPESKYELMNLDTTINTQIDGTWSYKFALINSAAFGPDGRHIAAGCLDGFIRIWKAASPEEVTAEQEASSR